MSSNPSLVWSSLVTTLTPIALQSEACPWTGSGWRAVEAQHKNATIALTHGDVRRQAILEGIIEEVKPRLPASAEGLHFCSPRLFGINRHRQMPPASAARSIPVCSMALKSIRTACAETGYWRYRFWKDSTGLHTKPALLPMTLS